MTIADYARKAWELLYNPGYGALFNVGRGMAYVGIGFLLFEELTNHHAFLDAVYHQIRNLPPHEQEFASSHHHHLGEVLMLVGISMVLTNGIVNLAQRVSSLEQKLTNQGGKEEKPVKK